MNRHNADAAKVFEHMRNHAHEFAAVKSQQLVTRHRRIGKRTQQVKDGAYADIAARLHGVFHRLMEQGRKQETDADLIDASLHSFLGRIYLDSQGPQHIGAPRLTRHRAVAMLGNVHARSCDDESRRGGDIESPFWSPPVPQVSKTVLDPTLTRWA